MKAQPFAPLFAIATAALAITVSAARADDQAASGSGATSSSAAKFEALKKLVGDWYQVGTDGKPTDKLASRVRLTAQGSVIEETLMPGTSHEMVTMYHLDGSDLVLTHYCVLGNQPRLRAEPGTDASRLEFKFVSATNLKSADENHMDHATITLVGPDRMKTEWVSCMDGKPCHKASFDLVRKAK